jgi:stage III sporulation protein AB
MLIKLTSCLTIIFGCGYVGLSKSNKLMARIRELTGFEACLNSVKFNITFLNLPLKDALSKISSQSTIVRQIFQDVAAKLQNNPEIGAYKIWKEVLHKNLKYLSLKNDDFAVIFNFAKRLGNGDAESEAKNIDLTLMKLKLIQTEAYEEYKTKSRLYKGAGFLVGILIVVLLF